MERISLDHNDSSDTAIDPQSYASSLTSIRFASPYQRALVVHQLAGNSSIAADYLGEILIRSNEGDLLGEALLQLYANSVLATHVTDLDYTAKRLIEMAVQTLLVNEDPEALYATNVLLRALNIPGRTTVAERQAPQLLPPQTNAPEPEYGNVTHLASLASCQPDPDFFTQTSPTILHQQQLSGPQNVTDTLIDPSLLQQTISLESKSRISSAPPEFPLEMGTTSQNASSRRSSAPLPHLALRCSSCSPRSSPRMTARRAVLQTQKKEKKKTSAKKAGIKEQQKSKKSTQARARMTSNSTDKKSTTKRAGANTSRTTLRNGGFAPPGMRYVCPLNTRHGRFEPRCTQFRQKVGDMQAHVRNAHGVEWGRGPRDWDNCGPFTEDELKRRGVKRSLRKRESKKDNLPFGADLANEDREEGEEQEEEGEGENEEESQEDADDDVDMSNGDNEPRKDRDGDGRGDGHARPQLIAVF